jgi:hypothetical protein
VFDPSVHAPWIVSHAQVPTINWVRPLGVCIKAKHALEVYSCFSVVKDGNVCKMWYSFRDSRNFRGGRGSYRLG